jgi:hypothetical protein
LAKHQRNGRDEQCSGWNAKRIPDLAKKLGEICILIEKERRRLSQGLILTLNGISRSQRLNEAEFAGFDNRRKSPGVASLAWDTRTTTQKDIFAPQPWHQEFS